jgi:hypothetical protein
MEREYHLQRIIYRQIYDRDVQVRIHNLIGKRRIF